MSFTFLALVAGILVGVIFSVVTFCLLTMAKWGDTLLERLAGRLEDGRRFEARQTGRGEVPIKPLPGEACKNPGASRAPELT